MARTLSRIAHEIIERNDDLDEVALVGIHTRGVPLAQRLRRLIAERAGDELPLGQLDITFHRDDVHVRGGQAPRRARRSSATRSSTSTLEGRTVILVDDVLYTGRTIRAAIDALFEFGRPARVQLAVLADRGHRELPIRPDYVGKNLPTSRGERVQVQLVEVDEVDQASCSSTNRRSHDRAAASSPASCCRRRAERARHLLSIADLTRDDVERLLATARSFARSQERETKKLPTLRGRLVVNLFYESSTRTSSSFELAAKRLSADMLTVKAAGSSVDKGESLKDTALTLSAYEPDVIVIRHPQIGAPQLVARVTDAHVVNAGDGKHQHPTQALLDLYTIAEELGRHRRRARRDRRRRPALARRPLARPGAAADGRARSSSSGRRRSSRAGSREHVARHRRDRATPTSSTSCACSASACRRARLRPVAARVHRALGRHAGALRPGQRVMHPGPMNRGVEIDPRVADAAERARRRPGAQRPRRADGGALRPARRPGRCRSRPRWRWRDARREGRAATNVVVRGARVLDPGRRASTRVLDVRVDGGVIAQLGDRRRHERAPRDRRRTGSCSRRRSSTRTSTCARRGARTRRRSPRAPRRPRPAATARSSRCRTPIRSSTAPTSLRGLRARAARRRPRCRSASRRRSRVGPGGRAADGDGRARRRRRRRVHRRRPPGRERRDSCGARSSTTRSPAARSRVHCEEPTLTRGGHVHAGAVSAELGLGGWPALGESLSVARDLALAADTGRPIHLMHLSARESVELLRRAQARGRRGDGGGDAAPPLPHRRGRAVARPEPEDEPAAAVARSDRAALIDACGAATIAAIATDHAPHAREEKDVPFEAAPFGVTGLETAFAALYTYLVEPGAPAPRDAARADVGRAGARSSASSGRGSSVGAPANLVLIDTDATWRVREERFRSRSANSWLLGERLRSTDRPDDRGRAGRVRGVSGAARGGGGRRGSAGRRRRSATASAPPTSSAPARTAGSSPARATST